MKRPAILIPLPTAADDHQTRNALAFERAGAAVILHQSDASATRLADLADQILGDPVRYASMSAAMGGLARPQATRAAVAELQTIARRRRTA
jgi:UDP-N-acetylglucosamine--N-acetylmuramyl-(pentapeptide) pyrophosphoryl-undecaprenol N-acetylglucosamine transferase